MEKRNKNLLIVGGVAVASLLGGAIYFLYKKLSNVKLSAWHQEYLKELEERVKDNSGKDLPLDLIAHIFHLISEVEEYLYLKNHADLEAERRECLSNRKDYEMLIFETMEAHEKYFSQAYQLVEQSLGVSFETLQNLMSRADKREIKEIMSEAKKPYPELPAITKENLRSAYVFYAKTLISHSHIANQQIALMNRNPEYQEMAMKVIFVNKYVLKDTLQTKFGIEEKYLDQLIKTHNLLEDPEIKFFRDELRNIDTPI